ncbi:MAG: hypothetical protein PHT99_08680 [Methanoregula sp.]|nr:hypothetical protein [Methanoregula sp.]
MVLLEEEDFNLARMLGLTNLSEYVRDSISYFISGCDRELTPSEIRELSKKIAIEKRAELQRQQKITGQTDEEKQAIEQARQERMDRVRASVKIEMDRIGMDRFKKYMTDTFGDYQTIQDDCLAAISKDTGFPVELADVLAVTGWRI